MKIIKIMILFILIIALFGLVGLYSLLEDLGTISYFFQQLLNQYEWFYPFLQGVTVAVTIFTFLFLLIVSAKPIVKNNWRLKKELGQVNFSSQSLAAIAKASLHELIEPENVEVSARMTKKHRVNVDVIVSVTDYYQLQSKGEAIQNQISGALPKMAKLEVGEIRVVFKPLKTEHLLLSGRKKEARVI